MASNQNVNKVVYAGTTLIDLTGDDVTAASVLSGKKFHLPSGAAATGTIATKTKDNLLASGKTVTVPAGYYASQATKDVATGSATAPASISGSSATVSTGTNTLTLSKTVSVTPSVSAGYVSSGTAGNSSVSLTASVTTKAADTITPTTSNQTIAAGTYLTGAQTIAGSSNLVAGNIKSGVSIFGVTGSYDPVSSLKTALSGHLIDTASGSTASFSYGASGLPLKRLTVSIRPSQSGSGNPSPTNVRTISGYTSARITRSGTTYTISFPSSAGTVYAGTLTVEDDGTGTVVLTHGYYTINGSQGFTDRISSQNRCYFSLSTMDSSYIGLNDSLCVCDRLTKAVTSSSPSQALSISVGAASSYVYLNGVKNISGVTDLASLQTWLSSNNVHFTYKLKTPVGYPLTATQVTTVLGSNSISANCGNVSVIYQADPNLWINAHT